MRYVLRVDNDPRALASVQALAREALRQTPLAAHEVAGLVEFIVRCTRDAVEHAYPKGEEGWIEVGIAEERGKLVVSVRDYGMPVDVDELERTVHESGTAGSKLFGMALGDLADDIRWIGFGPEGKALQLSKWLHTAHIRSQGDGDALEAFQDDAVLAPEQPYTIRRMVPEDAVQISQLMYRAYGGTYFNRDVYYPKRIVALNTSGAVFSVVAQAADGRLAGHYALERNREGPVAESGQAVVDPAHRGRGLLARMRKMAIAEARRLGLVGLYADAVSVHTRTQQSEVHHGARLTGVDLGISPRSERFRGISEDLAQRVTCLLYFLWLRRPESITVHVPPRHREITEAIYANLGCPVRFGDAAEPTGEGAMTVGFDAGAGRAVLRVDRLGGDTEKTVRHVRRNLVEHSHAEVVFLELPLQDPGTPGVAIDLERDGFSFSGIAPWFSPAGDMLRLVYLTEPLEREPIKTFGDFEARLVDYTLSEQARVVQALD